MKLLVALRWLNGFTLAIAIGAWLFFAVLFVVFDFGKSAAKVAVNTAILFGSGFQKNPQSPPMEGLSWLMLFTGAVCVALWSTVFTPGARGWLHFCAVMAAALLAWSGYEFRFQGFGPWIAGFLGIWFTYYWAAAWRG